LGAHDPDRLTLPARLRVRGVFPWPCFPRAGPFPPPPPPPVARDCSAASLVVRARLTSRARASRDYRLSVPLTARQAPTRHPANHPGRGIVNAHGRPRDLPVLAHGARRACLGSPTAQGPPATRESAASGVAFRTQRKRRHPELHWKFRGSIAPPARPLSTLRCALTERQRMTRGHRRSLTLRCRAFPSPSPCRFIPALSSPEPNPWSQLAKNSPETRGRPDDVKARRTGDSGARIWARAHAAPRPRPFPWTPARQPAVSRSRRHPRGRGERRGRHEHRPSAPRNGWPPRAWRATPAGTLLSWPPRVAPPASSSTRGSFHARARKRATTMTRSSRMPSAATS